MSVPDDLFEHYEREFRAAAGREARVLAPVRRSIGASMIAMAAAGAVVVAILLLAGASNPSEEVAVRPPDAGLAPEPLEQGIAATDRGPNRLTWGLELSTDGDDQCFSVGRYSHGRLGELRGGPFRVERSQHGVCSTPVAQSNYYAKVQAVSAGTVGLLIYGTVDPAVRSVTIADRVGSSHTVPLSRRGAFLEAFSGADRPQDHPVTITLNDGRSYVSDFTGRTRPLTKHKRTTAVLAPPSAPSPGVRGLRRAGDNVTGRLDVSPGCRYDRRVELDRRSGGGAEQLGVTRSAKDGTFVIPLERTSAGDLFVEVMPRSVRPSGAHLKCNLIHADL